MPTHLGRSRRTFLRTALGAGLTSSLAARTLAGTSGRELPRVDLHAHLDNSTIAQVAALGRERDVRLGIVEHAGTRENVYPVVLSNDQELTGYLEMLEGHGVWKGVQAEWIDWYTCFSPEVAAKLDYVLTDTMTFPGPGGKRIKLWEPLAQEVLDFSNREAFMDRYVDWHLEVMEASPFDILGNASWLPEPLAEGYETFWSERRVEKVVEAAITHGIAIEISSSYELPRLGFLKQARAMGVRFSFGSNGRYPRMGQIDHGLAMAGTLELTPADLFLPGEGKPSAIARWQSR